MKSTMEKDMIFIDGVMKIVPKELPNWYSIEGIGFVWHNAWADPEIEYKGKRCSCFVVEDTMWERFTHDDDGNEIEVNEEDFDKYMLDNKTEVYELCELALFND